MTAPTLFNLADEALGPPTGVAPSLAIKLNFTFLLVANHLQLA
jgi:hypothetical protein